MFPDYQQLVMEYYHHEKTNNRLTSNLSHPTPGKLKDEGLRLCREGVQKTDEKVIRDFGGEWDEKKTCLQIIRQNDIDKFKPLSNYLRKVSEGTDPKNIELLAWLIGFPDRPYDYTRGYEISKTPESESAGEDDTAGKADDLTKRLEIQETQPITGDVVGNSGSQKGPSQSSSGKEVELSAGSVVENPNPVERNAFGETIKVEAPENGEHEMTETEPAQREIDSALQILPRWRYWNACVAGTLLLMAGITGYWSLDGREPAMWASTNGNCMYWADDHYQPIPCNQKMPNKRLVALDTTLVKNFRKITRPDTITYRARGWVWYSKINNKVEFFTSDGEHPVVYGRPLRPITDYMIDKYIKQGMTSNP